MRLGWFTIIFITFAARLNRPTKLDCPDPSLMECWIDRARLFCPSGSNLGAGTCNNSDAARERRATSQIALFLHICEKTTPANLGLKPEPPPRSSRASPAAPTEPQSVPKWSPVPSNFSSFRSISHDLGQLSLKARFGVEPSPQNEPPDS